MRSKAHSLSDRQPPPSPTTGLRPELNGNGHVDPPTAALDYYRLGWTPIPVKPRSKNPGYPRWQETKYETGADVGARFARSPTGNIGCLLGTPSNGLIDVDCDVPEARVLAPDLLPPTGAIFGRAGNDYLGHRLYRVTGDVPATKKFEFGFSGASEGEMLVEFRSTGAQTIVPNSTHPDGEDIRWKLWTEPTTVDAGELLAAVAELAATVLLIRQWPHEGRRHKAALALAGGVLRAGWSVEDACRFVERVCAVAGEDQKETQDDRLRAIRDTKATLDRGQPATGFPTLAGIIGPEAVDKVREWLRLPTSDEEAPDFSDIANAGRFAQQHGDTVRYCEGRQSFYIWEGVRWRKDETRSVMELAKDTAWSLKAEALERAKYAEDKKLADKLVSSAVGARSAQRVKALIDLAKSVPPLPVTLEGLDADLRRLNCPNGTLDLRTGALCPHDKRDLITQVTAAEYDPGATFDLLNWFLEQASDGDEGWQAFLRRAAGYSLIGGNPEELWFVAHGRGGAGMGTFVRMMRAALGPEYAKTADFETFLRRRNPGGPRSDLIRLRGARFVAAVETERGDHLSEAQIKKMTGGDEQVNRDMYAKEEAYQATHTPWVFVNEVPKTSDSLAMRRRLVIVPFLHSIPKEAQDPTVKARLSDPEIAGRAVLAWLVRGCLEYQEMGLQPPEVVKEATEGHFSASGMVSAFIAERCDLVPDAWTSTAELFEAFEAWRQDRGVVSLMKKNGFSKQVALRFQKVSVGSDHTPGFVGIQVKEGV